MLSEKSLIYVSLILTFAFADAFIDGDKIAFKTHGSFFNANYQYLKGDTSTSSVGMAASDDYDAPELGDSPKNSHMGAGHLKAS